MRDYILKEAEQEAGCSAVEWHRRIHEVRHVPIERDDEVLAALIQNDPMMTDHAYCERDLREAHEFTSELQDMFGLKRIDLEMERPLWAALEFGLNSANSEGATVCGIVVGTIRALIENHHTFYPYLNAPKKMYPRSVAEVRAEIEDERKTAIHRLQYELDLALALEAKVASISTSDRLDQSLVGVAAEHG